LTITILYLLSLCFFAGNLGASPSLGNRLNGCLALLALLLVSIRSRPTLGPAREALRRLPAILPAAAAVLVLVLATTPLLWLSAAALLAFALGSRAEDAEDYARWRILGFTAAVYFLIYAFLYPLGPFKFFNVAASVVATNRLAWLTGYVTRVGPSVSGWWILVLFFCHLGVRFAFERSIKKLILGGLMVSAAGVAFTYILMFYPPLTYHSHTGLNLVNSQFVCFALCALSLLALGRGVAVERQAGRYRLPVLAAAHVLIVLAVCSYYFAAVGAGRAKGSGQVLVFALANTASFDTPDFERLGVGNSGMYGLLPKYLTTRGHDVLVTDSFERLGEELGRSSVLVVICPPETFPPELRDRIWKFVGGGGGLLVLGDHTDIFGSMKPLNTLLEPVNIRFNFDSAYSGRQYWRYSYEFIDHPVTRSLDEVNGVLQHGTGGSLSVSRPAYPVVSGKYTFGDKGDYKNLGSFLGDERFRGDERLGDLPLVAAAEYGRGKVLVFGDTSGFQNIAVPYSYPLIFDVFGWLSTEGGPAHQTLILVSLVLTALAAAALVFRGQLRLPRTMTLTMGAFTACFVLYAWGTPEGNPPRQTPDKSYRLAYVDGSHVGGFKLQHWTDESIDGLIVNLSRNGYLPFVMRKFSPEWLKASSLYVSVAPQRHYTGAEMEQLEGFIKVGGRALIAVGYEEREASQDLLNRLGFAIGDVPLGAAPITDVVLEDEQYQKIQQEPHFANAWPVSSTDGTPLRPLYTYEDFPIVASKNVGAGAVTVIGDSRFLRDKILENEDEAWPGNVNFVKDILRADAPPENAAAQDVR
jgi:hypothetical protein